MANSNRQASPRSASYIALLLLVVFLGVRAVHRTHVRTIAPIPVPLMQHEPNLMLWAWETPEDLTTLDTSRAGVAFLSRELILSNTLQLRPRRQPLHLAPNTWLMADVRIETAPAFISSPKLIAQTAAAIAAVAAVAQQPNVRAIQVDFDATYSQRPFYIAVLRELRPLLPPSFPLSITALASWCSTPSWLHDLPVDEAVPMFFRMGGPASIRATRPKSTAIISEPLCSTSIGIATDETWPTIPPTQRVYLFRQGPWTKQDLALLHDSGYERLKGVLP